MRYPLSRKQYDEMVLAQSGLCAICGYDGDRPLVIDHNHLTDEVRGAVCRSCNLVLGAANESADVLIAAALYLLLRGSCIESVPKCLAELRAVIDALQVPWTARLLREGLRAARVVSGK